MLQFQYYILWINSNKPSKYKGLKAFLLVYILLQYVDSVTETLQNTIRGCK